MVSDGISILRPYWELTGEEMIDEHRDLFAPLRRGGIRISMTFRR